MLIAADVYRPAAIDQLVKLGDSIEVEVFRIEDERNAVTIVQKGIKYGQSIEADTIIVDTAGRLQVRALLQTLRQSDFVCLDQRGVDDGASKYEGLCATD